MEKKLNLGRAILKGRCIAVTDLQKGNVENKEIDREACLHPPTNPCSSQLVGSLASFPPESWREDWQHVPSNSADSVRKNEQTRHRRTILQLLSDDHAPWSNLGMPPGLQSTASQPGGTQALKCGIHVEHLNWQVVQHSSNRLMAL